MTIDISIIIPAKDESARLPAFLTSVIEFCRSFKRHCEIIVVDDGSTDETAACAESFKNQWPNIKVIRLSRNYGKGHAVKRGFLEAQGEIVLFLDADGSTPAQEIARNVHWFEQGYDIIIGSRVAVEQGIDVKVRAHRKCIGMVFNFFVHAFLIKDIKDTQCGFKMFRRSVVGPLFGRVYLDGFGFDLEVLYLAKRMGYKIKEVAIHWTHVDGSKVHLVRDSWRMFINILQIKIWHWPPINMKSLHMSAAEVANMYAQEKEHWWFVAKGMFIKKIIQLFGSQQTSVLDTGCGTGHNMQFLKDQGFYVGCDVSLDALEFCRHNGHQTLVQCDLEQMAFADKSFGMILSLDVLEHTRNDREVLEQIRRLLKDEGQLVLTVPAFRFLFSPHDESLSHFRRYNKKDLLKLLSDTGFSVQHSGYLFCAPFIPVALIRIFRKIMVKTADPTCDTFHLPPKGVNRWMIRILEAECGLLGRVPMPFGTSLYAVAVKQ